jgi:hypothetical protein
MISRLNLGRLLKFNNIPKCENCVYYNSTGDGYCKLYTDIIEARVTKNAHLCSLEGYSFEKKKPVNLRNKYK